MLQKFYRSLFWTGYFLILITAFINIAGSFNDINNGKGLFKIRLDHLLHFTVYFLICIYYLFGQRKQLNLFKSNSVMKFIIFILSLATVTELVQLWVPQRTFNIYDWVANVVGLIVGMGVIRMARRREGKTALGLLVKDPHLH